VRRDGELVPVGWDEALDFVAGRLNELKGSGGGQTLGAIGASRCSNEENYLLQRFMRGALGSNNIDSGARLRGSALSAGIQRVLGYGAMTHPIGHIREAREILVVGADPLTASPILGQMIKQAVRFNGAHLTLIDPLPRGLAGFTDIWIRPYPGTQTAFLAGMLREMLSAGLTASGERILGGTGLERMRPTVEPYTPETVEKLTGVPGKLLRDTARQMAQGERVAVIPGDGVAQEEDASLTGSLLAAIALHAGDLGRAGSGLYPIALSLNDQGALDMGACPDGLPGHQDLADPDTRARFEDLWGGSLPAEPGMDYLSMIESALKGTLKGLYVMGENPARDCPDGEKTRQALSALALLVVQDLFLTETADLAHVVLPSASFAEKDGTFTSLERRVQRIHRVMEPVGESRPDGDILLGLMDRLGVEDLPESPADVLSEINGLVHLYGGITTARLEREREGIFWPCSDEEDPGSPILFARAPAGIREEITLGVLNGQGTKTGDEFPLWLLTTESLFHSKDGVRTSRARLLCQAATGGHTLMNPFDAGPLGIEDGDTALVTSSKGILQTRIVLSRQMPRGILSATSVAEHSPNRLFSMEARDPASGAPQMHRIAVKVEVAHGSK
jgi:predicted molibdopterin-dependent oxidoreductase YjgC